MVLQPECSPLRDGFCITVSQSELAQVKLNVHPQMTKKPTDSGVIDLYSIIAHMHPSGTFYEWS